MTIRLTLILLIIFVPKVTFCQAADYYVYEGKLVSGIKLVNAGRFLNSKFCQVIRNDSTEKYTPYEVSEYRFISGLTYKAFDIKIEDQIERYFLERLVDGKISLYYLRIRGGENKYYLLENDSSDLIEIPKIIDEYSYNLLEQKLADCQQSVINIPIIRHNRNFLTKYIMNHNTCGTLQIPKFYYGFLAGLNIIHLQGNLLLICLYGY